MLLSTCPNILEGLSSYRTWRKSGRTLLNTSGIFVLKQGLAFGWCWKDTAVFPGGGKRHPIQRLQKVHENPWESEAPVYAKLGEVIFLHWARSSCFSYRLLHQVCGRLCFLLWLFSSSSRMAGAFHEPQQRQDSIQPGEHHRPTASWAERRVVGLQTQHASYVHQFYSIRRRYQALILCSTLPLPLCKMEIWCLRLFLEEPQVDGSVVSGNQLLFNFSPAFNLLFCGHPHRRILLSQLASWEPWAREKVQQWSQRWFYRTPDRNLPELSLLRALLADHHGRHAVPDRTSPFPPDPLLQPAYRQGHNFGGAGPAEQISGRGHRAVMIPSIK